jgi:hypothetical protein
MISPWRSNPSLYEINTWVWLQDLGQELGEAVDLGTVPPSVWDSIEALHVDAVWFMGVWERSPAGIVIAERNQALSDDFRRALPNFRQQDNVGSPYCVRRYVVDEHLGGPTGLAKARRELASRGIRLLLDFVPNHVAPDHPWVTEHPEYLIRGNIEDLQRDPSSFLQVNGNVIACGRDPFFPAWPDVVQLNAFNPALRSAVVSTLHDISRQCDGVRCDMAMLLLNSIFERTWASRAGTVPKTEYWSDVISEIKIADPNFLFIAEAYWDLEWELMQKGFDYCYDKRLYDRLEHDTPESVRLHLCADMGYQRKLLRFLENHDEPRAAATFAEDKERVAAITIATVPGVRMFHDGQLEGLKVKLPVFLGRRPNEPFNAELRSFYGTLLELIHDDIFHVGEWKLCDTTGWPDNQSCRNLVAWTWSLGQKHWLIVVNLSGDRSQATVQIRWPELASRTWRLSDRFSGTVFIRDGNSMGSNGLYVELGAWGFYCLECEAQVDVSLTEPQAARSR